MEPDFRPPRRRPTRLAPIVAAALIIGFIALAPFAARPAPQVHGFIPALDTAIFLSAFVTAALLSIRYSLTGLRSLFALSLGYLFSALLVAAHGISYPEAFGAVADIDASLRITFRLYLIWHLGLPLGVIAYVVLRQRGKAAEKIPASSMPSAAIGVAAVTILAALLTWISYSGDTLLPAPLNGIDRSTAIAPWVTVLVMAICAVALATLWASRRSALDQWLMIALAASIVELAITGLLGGLGPVRSTVGFYTGRVIFSLLTSAIVLVALLAETASLHARAARMGLLTTIYEDFRLLSGEIERPNLIKRLLAIAVHHSGAKRALLILHSNDSLQIVGEAQAGNDHTEIKERGDPISESACSMAIVQHVADSRGTFLLDASEPPTDANSDQPLRSVICVPLLHQETLIGLLYLENEAGRATFTPEQAQFLELLASQAAISIENANLFADLQRSEAFLTLGQQVSHTGSFGWSLKTGDYFWSEEAYDILEYNRDVLPSAKHALDRVHPDDRENVREHLDAARADKSDFDSEHRLLMPDGRVKHIQVSGRRVDAGNIDFVVAVRDVTDKTVAEQRLRQLEADLAHISRVSTLNAMTASIGHEIAQPLTGILTNANSCLRMLSSEPPNIGGAADTARRSIRDANRASEVISRLRSMFSAKPPTLERVDIGELAREVITLTSAELRRRGAILETDFSADLPSVRVDRVQLQQVIMNLILNAADSMASVHDRKRLMLVRVSRGEKNDVRVMITDAGHGFDAEHAERLFQAFFTTKADGLGIGLSISRAIVERHGGRIWAEGNDGPGATFLFSIPAAEQLEAS
jgi:PAS domain S-box-containing protein